jgi:hypothetical protein
MRTTPSLSAARKAAERAMLRMLPPEISSRRASCYGISPGSRGVAGENEYPDPQPFPDKPGRISRRKCPSERATHTSFLQCVKRPSRAVSEQKEERMPHHVSFLEKSMTSGSRGARTRETTQQTRVDAPRLMLPSGAGVPSASGSARTVQTLQRLAGNQAVMRMLDVQRAAGDLSEPSDEAIRAAAIEGVRTPSTSLPYLDRIQASFGRHSIADIQAHVGPAATRASQAMSAQAYATGNHVVFGARPDLRTAAHEAAHIVQQRAGVQLSGGVGRVGDLYERQADAVANVVVMGRSAVGRLEPLAKSAEQWQSESAFIHRLPIAQSSSPNDKRAVQRIIMETETKPFTAINRNDRIWEPLNDDEKKHLGKIHAFKREYTIKDAMMLAKRLAKPAPFKSDTAYSDSEDEAVKKGNKIAKTYGHIGKKKIYNYTKKYGKDAWAPNKAKPAGKESWKKINNKVHIDALETVRNELEKHAETIHGGKEDRKTVTTSLMFEPDTGWFKKFAHVNTPNMPPEMRKRAEGLGYHVIKAEQAHAELQKIQYDKAREPVYEHESMAVDKAHCFECVWVMEKAYGGDLDTQTKKSDRISEKFYFPEPLREILGMEAPPTRDERGNLKSGYKKGKGNKRR